MRTTCSGLCGVVSAVAACALWAGATVAADASFPGIERPTSSRGTIWSKAGVRDTEAGNLVHQALAAEVDGQPEQRAKLLHAALQVSPDFASAHWHSGDVRVGKKWLPVRDAAELANRQGIVEQYRQRRDDGHNTVRDHLEMADWCAAHGLQEEERCHLLYALQLDPNARGAIGRLGLIRQQGQIMTRDQLQAQFEQTRQTARSLGKLKPILAQIRTGLRSTNPLRRGDALDKLQGIREPAAIADLENILAGSDTKAVHAAIAALDAMPQQASTNLLIRLAIYAQDATVRREAAEALQSRSLFSYVPTMMAALESPIEVNFESFLHNGASGHRLTLYQPGPLRDRAFISTATPSRSVEVTFHLRLGYVDAKNHGEPDTSYQDQIIAAQAEHHNALFAELNQHTTEALATATRHNAGTEPVDWWNWWMDYNEIYRPPYKPVETQTRNVQTAGRVRYHYNYSSCFVAGTPVWTSTGPMPIQEIRPGDCVLAQHPDTGELAYKAVIATTTRPVSPLVEIQVGSDVIRATRGHPFWVSGVGWQMAKQLQAGQLLHTTSGGKSIDRIENRGRAPCFNLVVADNHSYFVGNEQILVHDNLLRDVTTATVPGLVAEK